MNKRIGIVAKPNTVDPAYFYYFSDIVDGGGNTIVLINPLDDQVNTNIDLLVSPGGPDVSTTRQDMKPSIHTGKPDIYFEYFHTHALLGYLEAGIPWFGICRGMQDQVVTFGGKLVQHWNFPYSSPRGERVETLEVRGKNLPILAGLDLKKELKINSLHHQCMNVEHKGEMAILAVSKEGKNVEAVYHPDMPVAGVQYHPEELLYEPLTNAILNYLFNWKDIKSNDNAKINKRSYVGR